MKICFLDIDGVLNSEEYNCDRRDLNEADYVTYNWTNAIDPVAAERLNRLIRESGAKIVISSSWRIAFSLPEIRNILTVRGFLYSADIIDETPHRVEPTAKQHAEGERSCRGDEIAAWLGYDVAKDVTGYVILDDTADMLASQQIYFVHTSWAIGLQDADVDLAIYILEEFAS